MEQHLLSQFTTTDDYKSALSLITNPSTSASTLSTLTETLTNHNLQNLNQTLSLLTCLSLHHPNFLPNLSSFITNSPIQSIPHAITILNSSESISLCDESLFLSLCYTNCLKTRRWTLNNVQRFTVRESVLVTVLLGFTKDPFPYIRESALEGLVFAFSRFILVDDLVRVCYARSLELLFDEDTSVRRAAVSAVSECGLLLVALNSGESKLDCSNALFVQLCLMTKDMDMEVRVNAFTALGKIQYVSTDLLLQTLLKKATAATNDKYYPGQYTARLSRIPASACVFAFAHGLEDEYYEVRKSACHALQMLTTLSVEFTGEAVHRVMDLLNDDSVAVRVQALETLYYMNMHNDLKVEESHLHMFLGSLHNRCALTRSAARKVLQSTKLKGVSMFKSCIEALIKNLELYSQDEAKVLLALFEVGRNHGKFAASFVKEVSHELEPSFDAKMGFSNTRTAALIVVAISAPVSLDRRVCTIPPQLFSYAVTFLDTISRALIDVMDKNTLLMYLSHCSRLTDVSHSEFCKVNIHDLQPKDMDVLSETSDTHFSKSMKKQKIGTLHNDYALRPHVKTTKIVDIANIHDLQPKDMDVLSETSDTHFSKSMENQKISTLCNDYVLRPHVKTTKMVDIICQKIMTLWPLMQLGCQREVIQTLRSWKEELRRVSRESNIYPGALDFALIYVHVIKLLTKACSCLFSMRNCQINGTGVMEILLEKIERGLKEMLYRCVGLSGENEMHILELILVAYTMRLSYTVCFQAYMKKIYLVLSRIDHINKQGTTEVSQFLIELQKISHQVSDEGLMDRLEMLEKSLDQFSLRRLVLTGDLKYMKAELDIHDNSFQSPLPFVSGLPVGIPFDIALYNISGETRLWLTMTISETTQFFFLDTHEFGGCNEIRKSTFIVPLRRTPKVKYFSVKVSIAMECLSEVKSLKHGHGPKHELVHLCSEVEVHLLSQCK